MDSWDLALLAAAGYLAVTALVRLMLQRRNETVGGLLAEAEAAKRRERAKKKHGEAPLH